MSRRPTRSTRTVTLFPYTTLVRSPISVKSLLGLPLVVLLRGTMGRSVMGHPRLQKQFEQHARLQTDNVNAVSLFVEEGHGCVIGTKSYLREQRSEEHTSELQSLMRISYAVFCLKKKKKKK